jgi:hypothetical protein
MGRRGCTRRPPPGSRRNRAITAFLFALLVIVGWVQRGETDVVAQQPNGSNGPRSVPTPVRSTGHMAQGPSSVRWKPVLTVGVIVLVLFAVGLAQTQAGWSAAESLGIAAPVERFTELYFAHPYALGPEHHSGGRSSRTQTVSFAIRNDEGTTRRYLWIVRVGGVRVDSGSTRLRPGGTATISREIASPCRRQGRPQRPGDRFQIGVALTTPPQSISYLTSCNG